MRKTVLVLLVILLLSVLASSMQLKIVVSASSNVIYVPRDFPTIQKAIDNATLGSTIIVNGTYHEDIMINKSLSLFGVDSYSAEIQGVSRYVVSIAADNVHIKNFTITKTTTDLDGIGIRIYSGNNNTIENNKITNINTGIFLSLSNNNTISRNFISNRLNVDNGIGLYRSRNNFFSDNVILNNTIGVLVSTLSNDNVFSGNIFINNSPEVNLDSSSNNVFYHNSFNGSVQMTNGFSNYWSASNEGNYWGSYIVSDSNNDGIGDQPYTIDQYNQDSFPLMGRFSGYTVTLNGKNYGVAVISNSPIKDFSFDIGEETGNKIVIFNVSNGGDAIGFCRIMIPTELMSSPYVVLVSGEEIVPSLLSFSNETVAFLYFTYVDGNQTISVISSKTLYLYYDLLDKYVALQASFSDLNVSYYQLLNNYSLLLYNYTQLQNQYSVLNMSYQEHLLGYSRNVENMQNLVYVFASTTAIFLMTTVYLSKRTTPRNRSRD
jgi:parallel beta-helix repeat protein